MSIASRVSAWQRLYSGLPGSFIGTSSSFTGTGRRVEIYIDEAWVDITAHVRFDASISITRGRSDDSAETERSTCRFTLDNRDGRYSPRNPLSPYYGKIGRNTQCRVSVQQGDIRRFRFYGEISAWPPMWDITGTDVYVQIEASGIIRRLTQGAKPLQSPLRRQVPSQPEILGYWPMEEGDGATRLSSPLSGVRDMAFSGMTLASESTLGGSSSLPALTATSKFSVSVPKGSAGEWWVEFMMKLAAFPALETELITIALAGTSDFSQIRFTIASGSIWRSYTKDVSTGVETLRNNVVLSGDPTGLWVRMQIYASTSGSNTNLFIRWTEVGSDVESSVNTHVDSVTFAGAPGRVSSVSSSFSGSGLPDTTMGHLSVFDALSFTAYDGADHGFNGETASTRIARLCGEQSVPVVVVTKDQSGNTVRLGPQGIKTFMDLVKEAVATDLGILFEPCDQFALGYRTRLSLYNQEPVLSLVYADHELSQTLSPIDDDQSVTNDVTISRSGGSSARAFLEEGPLSIQAPPNGIGLYDEAKTISILDDDMLLDQAGWRLHLETVDEPRYPTISVNLMHSTFTNSVEKHSAALTIDIGDRLLVMEPPPELPPDDISQLVQGFSERIGGLEHELTMNCSPEMPYRVGFLDTAGDEYTRVDLDGSTLSTTVDSAATSLSVALAGDGMYWTVAAADFPFSVVIGGEIMSVTNVTGTTSPQTFTVTRSVNGVVKSQAAGTDIKLYQPTIISL